MGHQKKYLFDFETKYDVNSQIILMLAGATYILYLYFFKYKFIKIVVLIVKKVLY